MQITFDALDHFDLLSIFIQSDSVWVCRAKEDLEDLKWVTIEAVALNLAFSIYIHALD